MSLPVFIKSDNIDIIDNKGLCVVKDILMAYDKDDIKIFDKKNNINLNYDQCYEGIKEIIDDIIAFDDNFELSEFIIKKGNFQDLYVLECSYVDDVDETYTVVVHFRLGDNVNKQDLIEDAKSLNIKMEI